MALAICIREEELARLNIARRFKFEEMWTRHELYDSMVQEAWELEGYSGSGLHALRGHLARVTGRKQEWGQHVFGSMRLQIKRLKADLQYAKEKNSPQHACSRLRRLKESSMRLT